METIVNKSVRTVLNDYGFDDSEFSKLASEILTEIQNAIQQAEIDSEHPVAKICVRKFISELPVKESVINLETNKSALNLELKKFQPEAGAVFKPETNLERDSKEKEKPKMSSYNGNLALL